MRKLAGYMKPFIPGVILVLALLFVQAFCDLNLPNYMSDIVNVGLQQGGIDHSSPDRIYENTLELIVQYAGNGDDELIRKSYETSRFNSSDMGAGYAVVRMDAESRAELDAAFGRTALVMGAYYSMAAEDGQSAETADVSTMLGLLKEPVPEILSQAQAAASQMPETVQSQAGLTLAGAVYQSLGEDMEALQRGYIIGAGLKMLGIALLGGLATVSVALLGARIAAGLAKTLRRDVFRKVTAFSSAEMDKFSTASLITRTTNDVTQVQMFVQIGIRMMFYSPIMMVGGVVMVINKAPSMAWIIGLSGGLVMLLIGLTLVVAMPKFKLMQKLVDKLNLVSRESVSGLLVIRAFGREDHEKQRFEEANKNLAGNQLFVNRTMSILMPAINMVMQITMLLIIWIGAEEISRSNLQIGDMMAFTQYAMQVIMSFLMMSMMFMFMPRASVAAGRISEVLTTEQTIKDPAEGEAAAPSTPTKTAVEFKDVSFRYEGAKADALSGINFTAKYGETTALIGATGSGKSTIANLLMRFYELSSGSILVDGCDIRKMPAKKLRQSVGYVPQKSVLLSGTVESNLAYGMDTLDKEKVREAAEIAQAMTFVNEKPEGFGSLIAEGGSNVSGGQKQRLSIGRALASGANILLFDDSFSALDFRTDLALRKALSDKVNKAAVIVIAQRVSTIMRAERILVLDAGKIIGAGTHDELMKDCPEYREIAESQLSLTGGAENGR